MIYTMCKYIQAKVFASPSALLHCFTALEMSVVCLQLRVLCEVSASGVTDMGLFQSFDVLLTDALG